MGPSEETSVAKDSHHAATPTPCPVCGSIATGGSWSWWSTFVK